MRIFMRRYITLLPLFVVSVLSIVWLMFFYDGSYSRLLQTPNQAAYKLYQKGEYKKAGELFESLSSKAASYYKAGLFKEAKSLYENINDKEGRYNLGNSCVMLGEYDCAIDAYEVALQMDSNFTQARENLIMAKARKILKEPENDGEQGVGELGADEIVYDNNEGKGVDDDSSTQEESGSGDQNWLDRLQTGPEEFLRNKFAYQYQMQRSNPKKENRDDK